MLRYSVLRLQLELVEVCIDLWRDPLQSDLQLSSQSINDPRKVILNRYFSHQMGLLPVQSQLEAHLLRSLFRLDVGKRWIAKLFLLQAWHEVWSGVTADKEKPIFSQSLPKETH